MNVFSKFRKEFILKQILGFGFGILLISFCFYKALNDETFVYKNDLFIVGSITSLLFIIGIISLLYPKPLIKQIIVSDEGIKIKYFISKQIQFIKYEDITSIDISKIKLQVKSGYITDGYYVSNIQLSNGNKIIISHDEFENYHEIMLFINSKLAKV